MVYFILWYISGLIGTYLMIRDWTICVSSIDVTYLKLLKYLLIALSGGFVLTMGVVTTIITWFSRSEGLSRTLFVIRRRLD